MNIQILIISCIPDISKKVKNVFFETTFVPSSFTYRWRAQPIRLGDWKQWFDEQARMAGKVPVDGLYVGLRMDGRVRASGVGCPPWAKFAAQLPPTSGFFQGFLDGMDGRV